MIPRIRAKEETPHWQQQLTEAITNPKELFELLGLDPSNLPAVLRAGAEFKLKVTQSYLRRMEAGNPADPLLMQILPSGLETAGQPPEYALDPVGDQDATRLPGLIHKYHGRVLLVTTAACAVHCRYCFRRHFPYADSTASRQGWERPLEYIAQDKSINEVILSGGDPLVLTDDKLSKLINDLEDIPHLSRIRIHSRLPVVLPDRLTPALLARLNRSRLQTVLVIHANHPNEIDAEVTEQLMQARASGLTLLNQSVLLRDINDAVSTLALLSEKLFAAGVLPYYLHLLDQVQGAAHFDIERQEALRIYRELSHCLPGYLLPRLAQEEAGKKSKTLLGAGCG